MVGSRLFSQVRISEALSIAVIRSNRRVLWEAGEVTTDS